MNKLYDYLNSNLSISMMDYYNNIHEACSLLYFGGYISEDTSKEIIDLLDKNIKSARQDPLEELTDFEKTLKEIKKTGKFTEY